MVSGIELVERNSRLEVVVLGLRPRKGFLLIVMRVEEVEREKVHPRPTAVNKQSKAKPKHETLTRHASKA